MSDLFFVALIGGSIGIAVVAVFATWRDVRAFDKKYGPSSTHRGPRTERRA